MDMSSPRPKDKPSLVSQTSFQIRRATASFSSNLRGLHRSTSSSSVSSFSSSEASTEATTVSRDSDFKPIGGLYMIKPDISSSYYTLSEAQQNLLLSVESQLCDVLAAKRHEYLVRIRVVGRTPSEFRPAIVLATSSVRTKTALTSYLLTGPPFMAGLRECRLDLHVILASAGAACGVDGSASSVAMPQDISVFVGAPGPCGARMMVQSPSDDQPRYSVAGGILVVGGENVFIGPNHTVVCAEDVHSVWRSATQIPDLSTIPEKHQTVFSVYYDEAANDSSCSDTSRDRIFASQLCNRAYDKSGTNLSEIESIARVIKSLNTSDTVQDSLFNAEDCEYTKARISLRTAVSDCVTLRFTSDEARSSASGAHVNMIAGFVINEVSSGKIDSPLPVTIALPDGEVRGRLHDETVTYMVGSHTYKLKTVTTDLPLKRGCSGAWVAHKNQLCGVIIAISDDEPEVFILPFEQIIEDLENISRGPVSLPHVSTRSSTLSSIMDVNMMHGNGHAAATESIWSKYESGVHETLESRKTVEAVTFDGANGHYTPKPQNNNDVVYEVNGPTCRPWTTENSGSSLQSLPWEGPDWFWPSEVNGHTCETWTTENSYSSLPSLMWVRRDWLRPSPSKYDDAYSPSDPCSFILQPTHEDAEEATRSIGSLPSWLQANELKLCDDCDKPFRQQSDLDQHRLSEHKKSTRLPAVNLGETHKPLETYLTTAKSEPGPSLRFLDYKPPEIFRRARVMLVRWPWNSGSMLCKKTGSMKIAKRFGHVQCNSGTSSGAYYSHRIRRPIVVHQGYGYSISTPVTTCNTKEIPRNPIRNYHLQGGDIGPPASQQNAKPKPPPSSLLKHKSPDPKPRPKYKWRATSSSGSPKNSPEPKPEPKPKPYEDHP